MSKMTAVMLPAIPGIIISFKAELECRTSKYLNQHCKKGPYRSQGSLIAGKVE
jgi:hypothetical protein